MLGKKKKNQEGEGACAETGETPVFSDRDVDFSALDREASEQGSAAGESGSAGGSPDSAELARLREDLNRARDEISGLNDKYLRALAEFENFKKRTLKERSDLLKYQGESIFFDLLEVIDNLELALAHSDADPVAVKDGLELIHRQFVNVLSKWDVRSDSALGKSFDPTRHNALSRVSLDDTAPGTVINELKKPYLYKDKLLRAGDVVVAAERPAASEQEDPGADSAGGLEDES